MNKYETPAAEVTAFEVKEPIAEEYGDVDINFGQIISKPVEP